MKTIKQGKKEQSVREHQTKEMFKTLFICWQNIAAEEDRQVSLGIKFLNFDVTAEKSFPVGKFS